MTKITILLVRDGHWGDTGVAITLPELGYITSRAESASGLCSSECRSPVCRSHQEDTTLGYLAGSREGRGQVVMDVHYLEHVEAAAA